MRYIYSLFCAIAILFLILDGTSAQWKAVQPRDDPTPSPSPSPSPKSSSAQSSSQPPPSSVQSSDKPSSTQAPSSSSLASDKDAKSTSTSSSESKTVSSIPTNNATSTAADTALNGAQPTSSSAPLNNATATPDRNALPYQPQVTPALAVAGVILLITGAIYTLIGIKNKWLHIFLSTAYLTSLSVTVLVVYVMNPPISKAIQGAYLVAAVITGLVFGALSIVFTEVTEGLGCLLGGFCLGMWFLTLKPGGLLTSTPGRVILVSVFCVAFFALSFSRYTRSYGLIAGISFGGATITILGIDCFSRAGLKEFWLYIWNLNDNIFPLYTDTFPHTRGIRVEIAAIIIIFFLGIASQMKLWKVVKERRDKRAAVRLEDERNLAQEEEDVGRRVEKEANRDRAEWEAVYGDKDQAQKPHADSGIGDDLDSVKKDSDSFMASREAAPGQEDAIEMTEVAKLEPEPQGPLSKAENGDGSTVVVRVARDDETITGAYEDGTTFSPVDRTSARSSLRNSSQQYDTAKMATVPEHESSDKGIQRNMSMTSVMTRAPTAIPLPFTVPTSKDHDEIESDASSIATFADSAKGGIPPVPQRNSKRESQGSAFKRLSGRSSRRISASTEALIIPHDDDQASSLAATVDEHTDDLTSESRSIRASPHMRLPSLGLDGGSLDPKELHPASSRSSLEAPKALQATPPVSPAHGDAQAKRPESAADVGAATFPEPPLRAVIPDHARRESLTESTNLGGQERKRKKAQASHQEQIEDEEPYQSRSRSRSLKSGLQSEVSGRQSLQESLNAHFPARLSKVVMTYRTNEWAKHLSAAEKPDFDEIHVAELDKAEEGKAGESAAPVMVEQLQQTPINAVPPPAPRSISQMSLASNSAFPPSQDHQGGPSRTMSLQSISKSALGRSLSQSSYANYSNPNLHPQAPPLATQTRGFRSPSTPMLNSTVLESPIEEDPEPPRFPSRRTPSPLPSNTLMGRRDTLLRNKFSLSNTALAPTPESAASSVIVPNDSASMMSYRIGMLDTDDIPLSQRKELIRATSQSFGYNPRHSLSPSQHLHQQYQQPLINTAGFGSQAHIAPLDVAFKSHQPKRDSNGAGNVPSAERRESLLASWRESVRADLAGQVQPAVAVDSRREEMLMQRQASLMAAKVKEQERGLRDQVFDERMKRADVMELHREHIRKMQAAANPNA
ncbi:MAG: hypothetical protein M1814_001536 [Vezdaea aestivalis]|nr:MAG: hypothetical protein M1814_001536 [Vezdaea aestivalis]